MLTQSIFITHEFAISNISENIGELIEIVSFHSAYIRLVFHTKHFNGLN